MTLVTVLTAILRHRGTTSRHARRGSGVRRAAAAVGWLAALLPAGPAWAEGPELELVVLDGTELRGRLASLSPDLVLETPERRVALDWSEVFSLRPLGQEPPAPPQDGRPLRFELADGSVFGGRIESVTPEGVVIAFRSGQTSTLRPAAVQSLMATSASEEAHRLIEAALKEPDRSEDVAVVSRADRVVALRGVAGDLTSGGLGFRWRERDLSLPWEVVTGVAFVRRPARGASSKVYLHDGEVYAGRVVGGGDDALLLQSGTLGRLSFAWPHIERIECRSERMTFLSELPPHSYDFQPFFEKRWEYALDRSLTGGPLRLGGRTVPKGISMHSRSVLRFRLNGAYRQFAATVGIADGMEDRGDVRLLVVGDGELLWEAEHVRGVEPPQDVVVPIADVDLLELVVDFGGDLDLSDHAVWALARVIR